MLLNKVTAGALQMQEQGNEVKFCEMRILGMCEGSHLQEREQLWEKQLLTRLRLAVPSELLVLSHLLTFPLII